MTVIQFPGGAPSSSSVPKTDDYVGWLKHLVSEIEAGRIVVNAMAVGMLCQYQGHDTIGYMQFDLSDLEMLGLLERVKREIG